jgi:hypothetical protein
MNGATTRLTDPGPVLSCRLAVYGCEIIPLVLSFSSATRDQSSVQTGGAIPERV